jgi:glycine cleavage system H protein
MPVPTDRKYLESHEWHQQTGDIVTIGITQIAADDLTDITYVELPAVGTRVSEGGPFGIIESVKATSDLYSGVAGTIAEINTELKSNPGIVNADPFGKGWMIKVKVTDPNPLAKLLSAEDYMKKVGH